MSDASRKESSVSDQKEKSDKGFFSRFRRKPREEHAPEQPAAARADRPSAQAAATPEPAGFFGKLKAGLRKTREGLKGRLGDLYLATRKIDEALLEEIEEMLIGSDIGVAASMDIIKKIRMEVGRDVLKNGEQLKAKIKEELCTVFRNVSAGPLTLDHKPTIILVVGVNGVGKTTTIGKIAHYLHREGRSVLICAADTFRAAAVEQLQVWAERAGVAIVLKEGARDPATVVYDALEKAAQSGTDVVLVDTAGRLHNNPNLMNELGKINRIIERRYPGAPHHVLLILDAVTGQNGLQQAKEFVAKVGVTDLVITKMDGTAKGGIAVAIARDLDLPIRFVGVGEQMDDLLPFDHDAFVDSLFDT